MTAMISKLLGHLHRPFDRDPKRALALRVRHDESLSWRVEGGVLSIDIADETLSVPLCDHTLSSLRVHLEGQGLSVPHFDTDLSQRSALILIDGAGDQGYSNGDHLYVYTSLLWAILGAYGEELLLARAAIQLLPEQMALPTSRGDWLDLLGSWYGIRRLAGESDDAYSRRIVAEVTKPKCNNIAIQDALATQFGMNLDQVEVIDAPMEAYSTLPPTGHTHHYAEFDVVMRPPFDDQILFDMVPWLKPYRAAGTRLRQVVTELYAKAPTLAATALSGETTTVYPYSVGEIEAAGVTYIAATLREVETTTIYPGN